MLSDWMGNYFTYFLLFFICIHIIADFYVQTDTLAGKKRMRYKYVIIHSLIYFLLFLFIFLIFLPLQYVLIAIIIGVCHFGIDSIKFFIEQNKSNHIKSIIFSVDQILHLACLFICALLASENYIKVNIPYELLRWITVLLLIWKPTNIIFKTFFNSYKPKESVVSENSNRAGSLIGILERTLILIFIYINQYASIGLILTAKSIARFDKINKDSEFAEYYLIGTLFSVISTILPYFIFFKLF